MVVSIFILFFFRCLVGIVYRFFFWGYFFYISLVWNDRFEFFFFLEVGFGYSCFEKRSDRFLGGFGWLFVFFF